MPGMSDSGQPDDIRLHLETILGADDARAAAVEGETEEQRIERESAQLPAALRADVEAALTEMREQVPGLDAAETAKLMASRAGRDALAQGVDALARVDSHLKSVTRERRPIIARRYGVYSENPTSFSAVMRALDQSGTENARIAALPPDAPERSRLFTPLVALRVERARDRLAALLATRTDTRAELARAFTVKDETLDHAQTLISAVREHLYANLPNRNEDDDLRDYGYRPIHTANTPPPDQPTPVPPGPTS